MNKVKLIIIDYKSLADSSKESKEYFEKRQALKRLKGNLRHLIKEENIYKTIDLEIDKSLYSLLCIGSKEGTVLDYIYEEHILNTYVKDYDILDNRDNYIFVLKK